MDDSLVQRLGEGWHTMATELRADLFANPLVDLIEFEWQSPVPNGTASAYVDIELAGGEALTWWLDIIGRHGEWVLETTILGNAGKGQYTIRSLPRLVAVNDEGLEGAITRMLVSTRNLSFYISSMTHSAYATISTIPVDRFSQSLPDTVTATTPVCASRTGDKPTLKAEITMQSAEEMIGQCTWRRIWMAHSDSPEVTYA